MRGLFGYAFLLLALVLFGGCDKAQVTAPNWPLKQVFGKDAAILSMGDQAVAEICPDNNCFSFMSKDKQAIDVVHDFAYLYLWQVESFDLATRKDAKGERFVVAILNQRKGNCSGADEDAIARCTLARMWASYKITGMERKFENGWNRTVPLDIAARLKQAGIIQ